MRSALCVAVWLVLVGRARAEDFYVDPGGGSMSGDGSASDPWSTLEEVVQSGAFGTQIGAGDTVHLRSGYHGAFDLGNGDYEPPIVVAAEDGETPELAGASIDASGIVLAGASLSPSHAPSYEGGTIVEIRGDRVTVEGCDVFSEADASGWGASEWIDHASSGFSVRGDDDVVRDNVVRNVRFGISVDGARALVDGNVIDGFSADGLRGLGDYGVFQYNVVKNVYVDGSLDDNHDDGFQSWSVGPGGVGTGEVVGVVLRGNTIINYEDPAQPLRATLQGIGCFDGTFVDWVIENNVVITDHWHGITLLGARGSRIVNNTVLDVNDETPGPPWISIDAHKDGTPPEDCVVRNNLATDFANADGVTEDHNMVIEDAAALFVDVAGHDLHLRDDAEAIDQGSDALAPDIDADRIPRPQGDGFDLGAYEWHLPRVLPADAGTSMTGMADGGVLDARGGASGVPVGDGDTAGTGVSTGAVAGAGGATPSAASGAVADAGTNDQDGTVDGGCGCRMTGATRGGKTGWLVLWWLGAFVLVARRLLRLPGRRRRVCQSGPPDVGSNGEDHHEARRAMDRGCHGVACSVLRRE